MKHKQLARSALIILLATAVASLFSVVPAVQAVYSRVAIGFSPLQEVPFLYAQVAGESSHSAATRTHSGQAFPQEAPGWQQVNSNGFGDQQTEEVSALEPFNGYLYAGTTNSTAGAQILRSPDGVTWVAVTEPGFGISHDIAPPAILDLTVFNGQLYASTGRGDGPGQIWRTADGVHWAPMVISGFSDPDTVDITSLTVYNSAIYAGAKNLINGAQVWRSFTGDSNSWTQVAPATPGTAPASVTGFALFNDALYAAIESDGPAQIWFSFGGDWMATVSDGFGDSQTRSTGGMAEFAGYLYAGAGNPMSGAQLWRTNDGETWEQTIEPGFGNPKNEKVELVFVFQNHLYASVKNGEAGMEIWRSANGAFWERASQAGFGDSNNTSTNGSNATAHFLNHLYVGTSNAVAGGELWRMQQPYGVALSPDDSLAGQAGQTVTYTLTITNTGTMTDSFVLTATGQTWAVTLSTQLVRLAPTTSAPFSVTVAIPPGAAVHETDIVTVTATSQGDGSKTDSALLTTTSVVAPVHGVALSPDQTRLGSVSQMVTYTLTITNIGNVVEIIDLLPTGNRWPTTLSTQVVTLAAGGSQAVTVTVLIPPTVAAQASDQLSIHATCRHDSSKHDLTVLTTVSTGPLAMNYLPTILSGRSQ